MKINSKIFETKIEDIHAWSGVSINDKEKTRWLRQLLNTVLIDGKKEVNFIYSGNNMVLCAPLHDSIEIYELEIRRYSNLLIQRPSIND